MGKILLICGLTLILLPGLGWAKTIYVPQDYPKIQPALDVSEKGDEIKVSPGTYYENITIPDGRSLVGYDNQNTIIADSGEGPPDAVVTIAGDCVLNGFTVTGARGAGLGHALVISRGSPQVINNIIRDNSYTGIGIHAEMYLTTAFVKGNQIYGNGGAGIANYGQHSESTITKNNIHDNGNAGVVSTYFASPVIEENTLHHNSVGVAVRDDALAVINKNDITANKMVGITVMKNSKARINGNTLQSNGTVGVNVDMNSQAEVLNNSVTDNGAEAIYFKGKSKGVVDSNQVSGNFPTIIQFDQAIVRLTRNMISSIDSPDVSLTISIDRSYCLMGGNEVVGGFSADPLSKVDDLPPEETAYTPNPLPFWKVAGGLGLPKWQIPKMTTSKPNQSREMEVGPRPIDSADTEMEEAESEAGIKMDTEVADEAEAGSTDEPTEPTEQPEESEANPSSESDSAEAADHAGHSSPADKVQPKASHIWGCLGFY